MLETNVVNERFNSSKSQHELDRRVVRKIPALTVPSLSELGLDKSTRVDRALKVTFLVRPLVAAAAIAASLALGWTVVALALVPLLYGTSLTLVHHCIHGSLRLGRRTTAAAITLGALFTIHSGHSLRATHLQHHRDDLAGADPEGEIEYVPWRRMPIEAPAFRYRLIAWAWRRGDDRGFIIGELAINALTIMTGFVALLTGRLGVALVIATMWFADVVFGLLAGKGPQTNWGRGIPTPLVVIRCRFTRVMLASHNFHLEHHLYPQVPLPRLALVADEFDRRGLFGGDADGALDVFTVVLP
jgi:beta-carotene hydroxylase